MSINRRRALGLLGMGAASPVVAAAPRAVVGGKFLHGVASGDPGPDRVLLWTRLTTDPLRTVQVSWQAASDEHFTRIVAKGVAPAGPARDHTVKVEVKGLKPGQDYFYRFRAGASASPVGRTRTLPDGPTDKVVLAVVTCALYPHGYFNAYDHIAKLDRVDAVVELGDYIYEYGGKGSYGRENAEALGRVPEPDRDIVTLADYRMRHAQYKRDPDLQAAHARAPWICVWDDHETANDSWVGGAENHHPATEGAWIDREQAAIRAYYEWMPIREPEPGQAFEAINRSFQFGDLASLIMLESRLQSRSYQYELDRPGDIPLAVYDLHDPDKRVRVTDGAVIAQVMTAVKAWGKPPSSYEIGPDVVTLDATVANPERQMLGVRQEEWLAAELAASVKGGTPWQVLGNQVVMARCVNPDIIGVLGAKAVDAKLAAMPEGVREQARQFVAAMSYALPFDLDGWNGYPAARERVYDAIKAAGNGNTVVLAGDSHAFWVNELYDGAGKVRVGAEFATSSITSPSIGDAAGFQVGDIFSAKNPEVKFSDQLAKGYLRLTLTRAEARAELVAVPIDAKPYQAKPLATWRVRPTDQPGVGPVEKV